MKRIILAIAASTLLFSQTSPFPASLDTDVTLGVAGNRIDTRLSASMTSTATSFTVANASRILANIPLSIGGTSNQEYVWVCSVVGTTISVGKASCPNVDGRGVDGSTAVSHVSSEAVKGQPIAWQFNAPNSAIKKIQTALGANLGNISNAVTSSAAYNFAYYGCNASLVCTPAAVSAGSLVIGVNVVTMTPCPLGVSGAHTIAGSLPHYLYISQGTGTDEPVAITGGTCTSGAATGTIIFTAANTHSGAWTLRSATYGVQETIYATSVDSSRTYTAVRMPAGAVTFYAAVTMPTTVLTSLRGQGVGVTRIYTAGGLGGNYINFPAGTSYVDLGDFEIVDVDNLFHTSGRMISVTGPIYGNISNIFISRAYDGLYCQSCANIVIDNIIAGVDHTGIELYAAAGATQSTVQLRNSRITTVGASARGIYIHGRTSGLVIQDCAAIDTSPANGTFGLDIEQASAFGSSGEIVINGGIYDASGVAIRISGDGVTNQNNWLLLNGVEANGAEYALAISNKVSNVNVLGGYYKAGGYGGAAQQAVLLDTVTNIAFSGTKLDATGTTGMLLQNTNSDINLSGVIVGRNSPNVPSSVSIIIGAGTTRFTAIGNDFSATPAAITNSSTGLMLANNKGIDDVTPTVASAGTLALPLNPMFFLSGNTGVTTLTSPLTFRPFSFVATHATPGAWTAGTGIGNTFTPTQNVLVTCNWMSDGKAYCQP